ncbi:MAG: immunoglobulin domain-containing protein [Phycisphaeraceae bacterium]|nr:immunoglobulin domain-containing protein [Phycisphaeraceae bacterium]
MNARVLLCLAPFAIVGLAAAQTGYSITGGLSNFDCHNHCDEDCDEFEIEVEGIHPEDVVHTYRNSNYGSPTVTLSPDGTFTIIDYRSPQHPTAVNSVEHFGISLRQLSAATPIRVRWMKNGLPATVNGQVPTPGGGTTPATQPVMPTIAADMGYGGAVGNIELTVVNNDPVQWIWIKRSAQLFTGAVTLEALMPTDPVVTTAIALDPGPVLLGPGATIAYSSDLLEAEDNQSFVFAAEYFQDLSAGGPFGNWHEIGAPLGNVMTATIASPEGSCNWYEPVILSQPSNTDAAAGQSVDLRVNADGNDLTLSYQWLKEGQELTNGNGFSGVNGDELSIDSLSAATEGFYSVRISNSCGSIVSDSALVFITGHNITPPWTNSCPAIADQPVSNSTCPAGSILATSATGAGPFTYQWQCVDANGLSCGDLVDGVFTDPDSGQSYEVWGSDSPVLYIVNIHVGTGSNVLSFAARVSNTCGESSSATAHISVCAADFNCDSVVEDSDFVDFADAYDLLVCDDPSMATGCPADMNGDFVVDDADFIMFAAAYDRLLCP